MHMEPVFTLQWPEFVVAQRLQEYLPRKEGYSVLVPLSRQEEGIDLAVLRHGPGDHDPFCHLPSMPSIETGKDASREGVYRSSIARKSAISGRLNSCDRKIRGQKNGEGERKREEEGER